MQKANFFVASIDPRGIGERVSESLGAPFVMPTVRTFSDGSLDVRIAASLVSKNTCLVHPILDESSFMQALLLLDALRAAGAKRILLCAPYLFYGRQGKSNLILQVLEKAGADFVWTIDLHGTTEGTNSKKSHQNFYAVSLLASDLKSLFHNTENLLIVSPDRGGSARAAQLAKTLGCVFVPCVKKRSAKAEITVQIQEGITRKHCLIVDDMVDSGATLYAASQALRQADATAVDALVTHAVFSEKILSASTLKLDRLFYTNTLNPGPRDPAESEVLDITRSLASKIQQFFSG